MRRLSEVRDWMPQAFDPVAAADLPGVAPLLDTLAAALRGVTSASRPPGRRVPVVASATEPILRTSRASADDAVEEGVAEDAVRVDAVAQRAEVGHPRVERLELVGRLRRSTCPSAGAPRAAGGPASTAGRTAYTRSSSRTQVKCTPTTSWP